MSEATYNNPVYDHLFPDPFVLKWCGSYWAYCTGFDADGRVFSLLHSSDLVRWQAMGGAMQPLAEPHPQYWAPEVTYDNGTFYMYYSVGDEATMHLRVATATHPTGPFVDSGRQLTPENFAIDAHIFVDDDGTRSLFYATDFLNHSHVGTGTARDILRDPFTLAGAPQPVTRARYDWQVYDPNRAEKGGIRWHTVEGPFVLKRKGRYYQMFSGGNWQNETYGVSYATTTDIATASEWEQVADGTQVLPVLRTLPGAVIGPGHNSIVRGPDNRQLYCVYHRWNPITQERVMAIDRQDWAGERMLVLGPSTTPQPIPNPPTFRGFSGDSDDGAIRQWNVAQPSSFIAEVSTRAIGESGEGYGIYVQGAPNTYVALRLDPAQHNAYVSRNAATPTVPIELYADFDFTVFHVLQVEVNTRQVSIMLDDRLVWRDTVETPIESIGLDGANHCVEFVGLALTVGYEDLFTDEQSDIVARGWQGSAGWYVKNNALRYAGDNAAILTKSLALNDYEFVVNARVEDGQGSYGFYPALDANGRGLLCVVKQGADGWRLTTQWGDTAQSFALPADFNPTIYQHFRFRKEGGVLHLQHETTALGTLAVSDTPSYIGLYAADGHVAFDMVRVTALALTNTVARTPA